MNKDIVSYNKNLVQERRVIAERLASLIDANLDFTEAKVWHGHPVWFINGNPIVGYSSLKAGIRLLFWSGQSFSEPGLQPEGSFKAAEAVYADANQIQEQQIKAWLKESEKIQWDYKNIIKRKGKLVRLG